MTANELQVRLLRPFYALNRVVLAMFYPDLGTVCQVDQGDHIRAIGWLHPNSPFPTGPVLPEFLVILQTHAYKPWQPVFVKGPHFCEFCPHPVPGSTRVGGSRNFWIPSATVVYVAPELVVHYIESHGYQPPEEFIAAVMACPPQESAEFFEMLRPFGYSWLE